MDDFFKHETAKFLNSYITTKTPDLFRYYFCKTVEHSSRVTRQPSDNANFHIPRTEQINCIGALNIRKSKSRIHSSKIRKLSTKRFKSQYKNILLNP